MPPTRPGWYAYMAPLAEQTCATDLIGPFDSRDEIMEWGREFGVQYRPNEQVYARAVLYAGEMVADDESDSPWFTACHQRVV